MRGGDKPSVFQKAEPLAEGVCKWLCKGLATVERTWRQGPTLPDRPEPRSVPILDIPLWPSVG